MPRHFGICILPSELPLDATFFNVATQLPSIHFGDERGLVRKSAIKALNSGETIVEIAGQATEIGLKLKV